MPFKIEIQISKIVSLQTNVEEELNFQLRSKSNKKFVIFSCDEQLKKWLGHSVRSFFCNQVVILQRLRPEVNMSEVLWVCKAYAV